MCELLLITLVVVIVVMLVVLVAVVCGFSDGEEKKKLESNDSRQCWPTSSQFLPLWAAFVKQIIFTLSPGTRQSG